MHVFVSYSRGDAAFVSRLVAVLEGDGHDVWVDTDDIRGSEEWRASIVRGIRQSDVVVLVVSSRSMASEEVAREVTVAAQESRRIVPLILEHVALSDAIGYELAGVQHVSFADRRFGEAVADLRTALAPARSAAGPASAPPRPERSSPPTPPNTAHTPPSSTSTAVLRANATPNRRRTALTAIGIVAVIAALGALVVRSLGGEDPDDAASATTPAAASDSPGSTTDRSGAAADSVTLDADVWFAGYEVAVHDAMFDPEALDVLVDVTLTNAQHATAEPLLLLLDHVVVEWNGRQGNGDCTGCSRMPPGASLNLTWRFSVDDSFSLADGVLAFGQPLDHRALVPFDGSAPTAAAPTTLAVSGVADDGAGTTFTVDRVELLPARCTGLSSDLSYVPGPADEISVVVWGTALTSGDGDVGFGTARLVLPDGTALGSGSLEGVIYVLSPAQPESDIPVCFSVRAPASGEYRFVAAAVGVEPPGPGVPFTIDAASVPTTGPGL